MKKTTPFLLFVGMSIFLASCFLFKKTPQKELPQAPEKKEVNKQIPEKEKKPEKEKETAVKKDSIYDVALLVPLDLDDVVSENFKIKSTERLPATTLDGLSFYEGALLAVDSLRAQNIPVRLHVYDSRSKRKPLPKLLKNEQVDSTDIIIGAVRDKEFKTVASFAQKHKINFISAAYPNDGGVTDNPYLYIVNSTVKTHCIALQSFAQKKFSNKKITVIYKNNAQGERNLKYLQEAYNKMNYFRKTSLHPLEWKEEDAETLVTKLVKKLDKKKKNVIVLTTLYPDISLKVIAHLMPYVDTYKISVVGMPTLRGVNELKNKKYSGVDIYYGSVFPYENLEHFPVLKDLMWKYFSYYHSRPSREALNGYEIMFYFGHLLDKIGTKTFSNFVNQSTGQLATKFSFQPIYVKGNRDSHDHPDYYENTRIYFLRVRNGKVSPAN